MASDPKEIMAAMLGKLKPADITEVLGAHGIDPAKAANQNNNNFVPDKEEGEGEGKKLGGKFAGFADKFKAGDVSEVLKGIDPAGAEHPDANQNNNNRFPE